MFSVARHAFPSGLPLEVGSRVPLTNGMSAGVVEVSDDSVKLDANHQLAGKTLTFDMELVAFAETQLSPPQDGLQRAVFGLGCFWGKFRPTTLFFSLLLFSLICSRMLVSGVSGFDHNDGEREITNWMV